MSKTFAFGLFLLISNFIVGKIAVLFFAVNRPLGIGIYLFSWLMLIAGLVISGKDGWYMAKDWYKAHENKLLFSIKHIFK